MASDDKQAFQEAGRKQHRTVYISGPTTNNTVDVAIAVDRTENDMLRQLIRKQLTADQYAQYSRELREIISRCHTEVREFRNRIRGGQTNRRRRRTRDNEQAQGAVGSNNSNNGSAQAETGNGADGKKPASVSADKKANGTAKSTATTKAPSAAGTKASGAKTASTAEKKTTSAGKAAKGKAVDAIAAAQSAAAKGGSE